MKRSRKRNREKVEKGNTRKRNNSKGNTWKERENPSKEIKK